MILCTSILITFCSLFSPFSVQTTEECGDGEGLRAGGGGGRLKLIKADVDLCFSTRAGIMSAIDMYATIDTVVGKQVMNVPGDPFDFTMLMGAAHSRDTSDIVNRLLNAGREEGRPDS